MAKGKTKQKLVEKSEPVKPVKVAPKLVLQPEKPKTVEQPKPTVVQEIKKVVNAPPITDQKRSELLAKHNKLVMEMNAMGSGSPRRDTLWQEIQKIREELHIA